jgi:hypothetical protein
MNLKNNPKLKKLLNILGGGLILLFIAADVITDAKDLDAVNKVFDEPSLLILPAILMTVVAIIAILYQEKKIIIKEKTKNIIKMFVFGFIFIIDIIWLIFSISFLFYATKIAKWFTITDLFNEAGIELNSVIGIISILIGMAINIGFFVYFLKNFLKYFKLVKNSKIITNN